LTLSTEAQARQALCATLTSDIIIPLTSLKVDIFQPVAKDSKLMHALDFVRTPKNGQGKELRRISKIQERLTMNTPK
jgi:predicted RNA-binding protein associated with RNAse of E/G family